LDIGYWVLDIQRFTILSHAKAQRRKGKTEALGVLLGGTV
jgi:hypothetical protein